MIEKRERESERERERDIYIYIHIYICMYMRYSLYLYKPQQTLYNMRSRLLDQAVIIPRHFQNTNHSKIAGSRKLDHMCSSCLWMSVVGEHIRIVCFGQPRVLARDRYRIRMKL